MKLAYVVPAFLALMPVTARAEISISTSNFLTRQDDIKVQAAVYAMTILIANPNVLRCTSTYTFRSRNMQDPVRSDQSFTYDYIALFARSLDSAYGLRRLNPHFSINITGTALGGANGRAPLGISHDLRDKPAYSVEINRDTVRNRTAEQIGGTILHEIMHNIGFNHGDGRDYDENYNGFMIKEWGLCIAGSGDRSLGLTDDPYATNPE